MFSPLRDWRTDSTLPERGYRKLHTSRIPLRIDDDAEYRLHFKSLGSSELCLLGEAGDACRVDMEDVEIS